MGSILKDYFDNLCKNDRVSHAFLICNSNFDNLKEDLSNILSDYFFEGHINILDNPDIYLIRPENGKILKESILNLQKLFKSMSQVNKNRVYIIDGAECMNDFASNSLLKFLEEPLENVYAFLITSNIDKVLPTIKSRCQVLMIDSDYSYSVFLLEDEIIDKAISFVECFEDYGLESIAYIYDFIDKKLDRSDLKHIIYVVKCLYRDILNNVLSLKVIYFEKCKNLIDKVSKKNNVEDIINKLIVLNKHENMLEYNLNLNLFLDDLIIEMGML